MLLKISTDSSHKQTSYDITRLSHDLNILYVLNNSSEIIFLMNNQWSSIYRKKRHKIKPWYFLYFLHLFFTNDVARDEFFHDLVGSAVDGLNSGVCKSPEREHMRKSLKCFQCILFMSQDWKSGWVNFKNVPVIFHLQIILIEAFFLEPLRFFTNWHFHGIHITLKLLLLLSLRRKFTLITERWCKCPWILHNLNNIFFN